MMIKYGIARKGTNKPLEFDVTSQTGEFASDISVSLEESGTGVWLVDTLSEAEYAIASNPEWFNESYETPGRYKSWQLEPIKIEMNVSNCTSENKKFVIALEDGYYLGVKTVGGIRTATKDPKQILRFPSDTCEAALDALDSLRRANPSNQDAYKLVKLNL